MAQPTSEYDGDTYSKDYVLAHMEQNFTHVRSGRYVITATDAQEKSGCGRKRRRVIEDDEDDKDVDHPGGSRQVEPTGTIRETSPHHENLQDILSGLPEDFQAIGVAENNAAMAAEDGGQAESTQHDEPMEQSSKERLVLLSVKIAANSCVKFAVSEDVLAEFPVYAKRLETAKLSTAKGKRLQVNDSKIRKEELVIQAIEYLADGILEPLDPHDDNECFSTLRELTALYEFSVTMEIATLEAAIVSHIGAHNLNPITLVYFAADCYQEGKDGKPRVAPDSSLGKLIKECLAENLDALVGGEAGGYITESGCATLNKQLMEIFTENMLA